MKLPLLNFKKINQKNSNRKTLINLDKKRFFLNNFVPHDSNTSSSSTIKKKTFDVSIKDGYQTQRIFKVNNSNKDKLFNLTKIKDEIVNNQNRYNILNSYSKLSNKATLNHLDSNENETSKSNNYEKYIKKAFGNLKIKKEILKNILLQNIKNQSHINIRTKENYKNEEKASENNGNLTCRICGLKSLNINSLKSNFQKKVNYKYNFENDELNKIFSNSNKKQKLARAFSNL